MVVRKRRKDTRFRATRTCGWGGKHRHRGSGNRGGVGKAGTGKRAAHKKIAILKYEGKDYYGKHGFNSIKIKRSQTKLEAINIEDLEKNLEKFAKKEGSVYVIDLNEFGYEKLLGSGKVKNKLKIICNACSEKAKEKIEAMGGEVVVPNRNVSSESS
ncbi:MAG: uL15 family ribosomal protein [Candidatus Nanoarchaeia archaeon]|nr:uL15 family ribosomal protein [Candidatus Nanoarchaeia archaeon]MDD5587715.1 uL15 family ribosomal protein [Candidatus Nanoarchaeia archaeon]